VASWSPKSHPNGNPRRADKKYAKARVMSIRRERDARRVAKSIRTHEATMEAYGNASGWLRLNSKAFDNKYETHDIDAIYPSVERGDRPAGDVIHPKSSNPRRDAEMDAINNSDSEPSRIGHTIGKGHVVKVKKGTYRPGKREI